MRLSQEGSSWIRVHIFPSLCNDRLRSPVGVNRCPLNWPNHYRISARCAKSFRARTGEERSLWSRGPSLWNARFVDLLRKVLADNAWFYLTARFLDISSSISSNDRGDKGFPSSGTLEERGGILGWRCTFVFVKAFVSKNFLLCWRELFFNNRFEICK